MRNFKGHFIDVQVYIDAKCICLYRCYSFKHYLYMYTNTFVSDWNVVFIDDVNFSDDEDNGQFGDYVAPGNFVLD